MKDYYWTHNDFIDKYAKDLTLKAQCAYHCLCRHANDKFWTNVGKKRIAKELGMNIRAAQRALQELEGVHLVTPYGELGGASGSARGRLLTPLRVHDSPPKELGTIKGIEIKKTKAEKDKEFYQSNGFYPPLGY